MNLTNRMVSSDNMGYASYLMEQDKNVGQLPGKVRLREEVAGSSRLCESPPPGSLDAKRCYRQDKKVNRQSI